MLQGGIGAGSSRLTFSLENIDGPMLNTFFTKGITQIMLPEIEPEESAVMEAMGFLIRMDLDPASVTIASTY